MKPLANAFVTVALCAVTSISPVYALQPQTPVEIVRGQTELQRFQSMVNNYNIEPFVTPAREAALQAARQADQIMQAHAYNNYISQGRTLDRTIEQRLKDLRDALGANDLSQAQHYFMRLQVAEQKKSQLIQDWIRATPSDFYVGESEVTPTDGTQQPPPQPGPPPPLEVTPPGPEVTTTSTTPPPPPSVLGVSLTTPVVVTSVAVAVGVGVAVNKSGDDTTDTTGGNE
ncbi:hypothetical protein CWE22_05590 [Pseudidiomarina aestuarii]|uniref:Uncharacterized protein n=1 Tax=Pseudidiomarina aestuarii TaxID=624146 RepID=A0A7Z6ZUM2_9GAMM|nr:hypothetical protein [Pseudidiomarina aestuarii]RUO41630.1 hypothetical protein CWE22_05590 [Pseudidiomarina aestuarii]